MLKELGFFDKLEWFPCPRWLYHLIKSFTSLTISVILNNLGLSIIPAYIIGLVFPVLIIHIVCAIMGKYKFNFVDTIFDTNCAQMFYPTILFRILGFNLISIISVLTWQILSITLYLILLKAKWNSP